MRAPRDPVDAVTHSDPYPYYADLASRAPLARDETLGMWVAASATAMRAVLASDACGVRPAGEPVPRALVGTAAGDLFGRLVRMQNGSAHRAARPAVSAALASTAGLAEISAAEARALAEGLGPDADPSRVTAFLFALPVHAVGSWLGLASLTGMVGLVDDVVAAFKPGAPAERIARGARAAEALVARFDASCTRSGPRLDPANAAGLLVQAYEATAGLLGNTLVALGRSPALHAVVLEDDRRIATVVDDVVHADPPVQNTRRFLLRDTAIAGRAMTQGDAVLVVLAAADRGSGPDETFGFGAGPHACPGATAAKTIATAGVRALLGVGIAPARLLRTMRYRPSVNTRIPLFGGEGGAS